MGRSTRMLVAALAMGAVYAAPASAAFVLLEDFQDVALGANLGAVNPGETFSLVIQSGQSPTATVVISPWDADNHAARVQGPGATLSMPFGSESILQGTTGTLFYQIYRTGLVNFSAGASDVASIADHNFGNYESQLNVNALNEPQALRMRHGGGFSATQRNFDINELYNVWHVINNTADTTEVYLQQVGVDPAPVQLFSGSTTAFGFRNGVANNDMVQFLLMTGTGSATDANHTTVFFDNIYVDKSGANLTNPIPEPGSLALLGLGTAMLACRRRR
jgi:hypothetical protein